HPVELLRQFLSLRFFFGRATQRGALHLLNDFLISRRRLDRQPARQEIIAPEALGNFDYIAARAELRNILLQYHFHEMTPVDIGLCLRGPSGKRQQSDVACLLDCGGKPPLMRCAHACQSAGNDLSALGDELRKQAHVFVVDCFDLLDAEFANLLATEELPAGFASAGPCSPARTATLATALSR